MTKNASSGKPVDSDPDDAPELTEAMLDDAELFEGDTFIKRGRGRPTSGSAKELVSLRLDQDVLASLRRAGPGWQTRVNGILREVLGIGLVMSVSDEARPVDQTVTIVQETVRVGRIKTTDDLWEAPSLIEALPHVPRSRRR